MSEESKLTDQDQKFIDELKVYVPPHLNDEEEIKSFQDNQKKMLVDDFMRRFDTSINSKNQTIITIDGEPQLNIKDGTPLTVEEIFKNKYEFFIQKDKMTTRTQVYQYLESKGFKEGSKMWHDEAVRIIKENNITKL